MATAATKVETISTRQLAGQLAEKHEITQKSANAMLEDTIGLITKHLKKGARIRLKWTRHPGRAQARSAHGA